MATNTYDDIYSTYLNQRFNRIDRRTLTRAVKPYAKQGITLAGAVGKSDRQLRSMAVKAVLAKFKASKAGQRIAAKNKPTSRGTGTALRIAPKRVTPSKRTSGPTRY